MIKVESKFKDFGINIPTDIAEITSETLDAILSNVVIAKHYCVVALCQNESLFGVINSKTTTVEVKPIIAKISEEDSNLINMKQMHQIIIDRSTLERGYHLYLKNNVLSSQFVNKYITNDAELTRSITVGTFGQTQGYTKGQKVWFLEFKIIAVNDLRAAIDTNKSIPSPFVYPTKDKAN